MMRSVLVSVTAALTLAIPATAHALSLDDALACGDQAHSYIASLQMRQLIADHPLHVEDNAINVFWPARHADLTAFGFSVYVVIGYQHDDPMFKLGRGEPMQGSLYGVVVSGSTAESPRPSPMRTARRKASMPVPSSPRSTVARLSFPSAVTAFNFA